MSERTPAEATAPEPTAAVTAGLAAATLEPAAGETPAAAAAGGMAAPQVVPVAVPVAAAAAPAPAAAAATAAGAPAVVQPVAAAAAGAPAVAAPAGGGGGGPDPARPRNRIQVSREKRPLNFFIGLAKKFLVNEEEVELSGLGLGTLCWAGGGGGRDRRHATSLSCRRRGVARRVDWGRGGASTVSWVRHPRGAVALASAVAVAAVHPAWIHLAQQGRLARVLFVGGPHG